MQRTITTPRMITLAGAVLAIAALVAVLMYLGGTPASAQSNPYPDPKPCGPGQQNPPADFAATITQGHYAVFDGYWDKTLNLNLCPPSVVHSISKTTDPNSGAEIKTEVSTRTASKVDIRQTVFHIDHIDGIADDKQFAHTLTAADVEKYDFFGLGDNDNDGVDDAVGTTVWWLKVDDESTSGVDEDSPLAMGFSAALFKSDYWYLADADNTAKGAAPLQYEFEVIREPGIPADELGHVFAFDDSDPVGTDIKTAFWDSSEVDANALKLYPGDYHHLQWAFTKAGTYEISVQLKGHVRQENPHKPGQEGYDAKWKAVSQDKVVTSQVMTYVFQIGPLTLNEEPIFEVERSVEENADPGTPVGDPIPVYQGDNDALTFGLSGPGHSLFDVAADADGNAQITVVGDLDYEERTEYRITLDVGDNKDHEGNPDARVDNRISVKINIKDLVDRSIAEDAVDDAPVGDPIVVPHEAGANLSYSLSGTYSDRFAVTEDADGNAQISLNGFEWIDYEVMSKYRLTLHVTGYADATQDHDIRVVVLVTDEPETELRATLVYLGSTPVSVGDSVTLWTESGDLPEGAAIESVTWNVTDTDTNQTTTTNSGLDNRLVYSLDAAGGRRFNASLEYTDGDGVSHTLTAPQSFTITWE